VAVQNRIVKIQKRNRALVRLDQSRIARAILRAARSIGGFSADVVPGINERLFQSHGTEDAMAEFLSESVVVCLNSEPHHMTSNFPPTIEMIQDEVLHVLRSYGLQNTADAYACYRWGRHWLREGAIGPEQFAGNGFPQLEMDKTLQWNRAHGCDTVHGLNQLVRNGGIKGLIGAAIAEYERGLDNAAAEVIARLNRGSRIRLLWITGPSCSGKTTTTLKLTARLKKAGVRFLALNLDDYFWPLVEHPTDWINDRNFETPEALDIELLNQHLRELLEGKTIEKPVYSFKEGRRAGTEHIRLEPDQVLLLDCLHGLYPPITEGIEPSAQFRVYIETLNMMYEGDGSSGRLTRFTDVRLMRRMLRDARHRNHSPLRTMLHWHYVRAGELFSILPLRGLADTVLNCGLPFDVPALKAYLGGAEGLLPKSEALKPYEGFLDARIRHEHIRRLLEDSEGLSPAQLSNDDLIPDDALIREFIGGGTIPIPHND